MVETGKEVPETIIEPPEKNGITVARVKEFAEQGKKVAETFKELPESLRETPEKNRELPELIQDEAPTTKKHRKA